MKIYSPKYLGEIEETKKKLSRNKIKVSKIKWLYFKNKSILCCFQILLMCKSIISLGHFSSRYLREYDSTEHFNVHQIFWIQFFTLFWFNSNNIDFFIFMNHIICYNRKYILIIHDLEILNFLFSFYFIFLFLFHIFIFFISFY